MMRLLAETTSGGWFHEYVSLLHDKAHIVFELTLEALTAIPGLVYARWWVKRHDKKVHNNER